MTKKVIITVGIYGVGKSYQAEQWVLLHPEYVICPCHDIAVEELAEELKQHDYVIMDYYFSKDPFARKLKELLQCEIEFWILFDKPEIIVQRQMTKPEMWNSPKDQWIVYEVYMEQLLDFYDLPETHFFDGQMKEYTKDKFLTLFKSWYNPPTKEEVETFLAEMDKKPGYDKYYHHFNLSYGIRIGKDGYARNEETWAIIKDWIDWKGKYVLDLCTFHGFFCQEIFKAGGKPTGMDVSTAALYTGGVFAKWANTRFNLYLYNIDTLPMLDKYTPDYDGYTKFPPTRVDGKEYDIIMLFNVLHHLINQERLLKSMARYPLALFEINKVQKGLIERFFNVIRETESPKDNRVILLCKPK